MLASNAGAAESRKHVFGTGNFRKKVMSESLAVHPDQIQEQMAEDRRVGSVVPDYDQHGRPTFSNSNDFRDYAKRHGMRHRGYA